MIGKTRTSRPDGPGARWAVVALLLWVACGSGSEVGEAERRLPSESEFGTVEARERVVSLSPLASRFVVALGAGHLLVGVDAASAQLDGLEALPEVDLVGAAALAPDLVLLPELANTEETRRLREIGVDLVEFKPHDLEDAFDLFRGLGARLVGVPRAHRLETELSRPLAQIGGASFGQRRPRTLALVSLEPLELAGGHSFETDLIEIAGGSSVTHGGEEVRIELTPAQIEDYAPELILVVMPDPLSPEQRRKLLEGLGRRHHVEFLSVDTRSFWLENPTEVAARLRAVIQPLSRVPGPDAS